MSRLRLLCQAAAISILLSILVAGCTRTVTNEVVVYEGSAPTTATSVTPTTTTTVPPVPSNWTNIGVVTPPQVRTMAAGQAWIGTAEARWTAILDTYQIFIEGQIATSQGRVNDCGAAWTRFQADRALFSPIPAGVAIDDANRQLFELVLGRIESNARICLAGHIGDFTLSRIIEEEDQLVALAQALDAVGADR